MHLFGQINYRLNRTNKSTREKKTKGKFVVDITSNAKPCTRRAIDRVNVQHTDIHQMVGFVFVRRSNWICKVKSMVNGSNVIELPSKYSSRFRVRALEKSKNVLEWSVWIFCIYGIRKDFDDWLIVCTIARTNERARWKENESKNEPKMKTKCDINDEAMNKNWWSNRQTKRVSWSKPHHIFTFSINKFSEVWSLAHTRTRTWTRFGPATRISVRIVYSAPKKTNKQKKNEFGWRALTSMW